MIKPSKPPAGQYLTRPMRPADDESAKGPVAKWPKAGKKPQNGKRPVLKKPHGTSR